jgi:photosystem II stability/assembly factor-like uncharacterized protein
MIILLVFSSIAYGIDNWELVRRTWYGSGQVMDIFFLKGTQYGWTVGLTYDTTSYQYNLARTKDGGVTWSPKVAPTLHSIFFIDSLQGWGVGGSGSNGMILHTDNGGETWHVQSYTTHIADNVYFVDRIKGWVGCYYGEVYHTEDGGQTWNLQYSLPDSSWIEEIWFTDSLTGYLVSDIPAGFPIARAYKTINGGQTWFQLSISFGIVEAVFALHFYNSNIGWIGTSYGIHSTTDGGVTWFYYSLPYQAYIRAIDFVDSLYGWAVGGDFELAKSDVYYTTDGGMNWIEAYAPMHNDIWSVSASDRDNIWLTGWRGIIMYSSDGGITWKYQAGPGNELISIDAPDTLNIWAGGGYGVLIHSTDAGSNWEVFDPGVTSYIYGVSFPTVNQGWVVGGRNHVRHTGDAGLTWQVQDPTITYKHWMTVDFVDTLNGWIAGYETNYYEIYHTSDGGVTWFLQFQVPNLISINRIHFFDANNGWAVGGDYGNLGYVFRTTDGGVSWDTITVSLPSGAKIYDADFVSALDGWAVSGSVILETNDGGLSWVTINDTISAYSVDFIDRTNGWVVGAGAFRTRDGGATWSQDSGNVGVVDIIYIDIVAKDTLHAWVGAGRGRVWRYDASVGVEEIYQTRKISGLSLYAYPNPFRISINIFYQLPTSEPISLKIYDVTGRSVKNLSRPTHDALRSTFITWDGTDDSGDHLAQGIYFVQLKAPHYCVTRKICKLK